MRALCRRGTANAKDARGRASVHSVRLLLVLAAAVAVMAGPGVAGAAVPGEHLWADVVSTAGADFGSAVAVETDAAGNPVVVGFTSLAGDSDIRYRSYDPGGLVRWDAVPTTWDNPDNPGADDKPAGVVVDDARNCVYVAGTTRGALSGNDIVVLKINNAASTGAAAGELLWARTFNAAANGDDEAEAVSLDAYGNVYVTGGSRRADGTMDVITVKYRPNGTLAWTRRHNNSTTRFDRGYAVAVRGAAVYVAGVSDRLGHRDDVVLLKYSLAGERSWLRYYDDALNRSESVSAIAPAAGAVYVCGSGRFTATKPGDALLLKYLSDGTRAWVRWVAGSGEGDDSWSDVAADDLGRPHVTGRVVRAATGSDIVTRLYRTDGSLVWQRGLSSAGSRYDAGAALAVDGARRTYVSGFVTSSQGDTEIVALKYSASATTLWATFYPDPANYLGETDVGDDVAYDIAVTAARVYVAGFTTVDHEGLVGADFLTLALLR